MGFLNVEAINKMGSEYIKERMEQTGLNQSELARRTGISQERISRIVNNQSRISLQDFVKLCEVLDADFTRDFMRKTGGNSIYYVNFAKEKSISNINTLYAKCEYPIERSELSMLDATDAPCLHPFSQIPKSLADYEKLNSKPISWTTRCFSPVCKPDGVWVSLTFSKNDNTDRSFFQLQPELAQTYGAEGLC